CSLNASAFIDINYGIAGHIENIAGGENFRFAELDHTIAGRMCRRRMPDHDALSIEVVQLLVRTRIRFGRQGFRWKALTRRRTFVRYDPGFLRRDSDMASAGTSKCRVAAGVVRVKARIDDPNDGLRRCRGRGRGKEAGAVPP